MENIDKAIDFLVKQASITQIADTYLKITQSVLNLAHAKEILVHTKNNS